jgi:hypothetical protein
MTNLKRWTIFLGVFQVAFGCAVGFIPPTAVPWFRGIVMAHIEFTANGVLMIALGLLVEEMRLPPIAFKAWFATLLVGTWANGAAGLASAFHGATSKLMPTLNEKFPPPNGTDDPVVTGLLMTCGITILTALLLTLVGLARGFGRDAGAATGGVR